MGSLYTQSTTFCVVMTCKGEDFVNDMQLFGIVQGVTFMPFLSVIQIVPVLKKTLQEIKMTLYSKENSS